MLALVDGRPRTLALPEVLRLFLDHRVNVIRRRTQYQLRQAKQRAHIVEGLLIALHYIDEVIRAIRQSANPQEAKARLMGMEVSDQILRRALDNPDARATGPLTRQQAEAILAMRLQQLTGLEADKLADEYRKLREDIARYEAILADERLIYDLIRADLRELKQKYANPRRTVLSDEELGNYDKEALIREEYMVVTITHDGYIKRLPPSTYRAQGRGGRGIAATNTREGDFLEHMFVALTHDYILFFTDRGKIYWLKVYDVPEAGRTAAGRAIVNLLQLDEGERVTGLIPVREFSEDEHLMMATRRGTVKKTVLTAYKRPLGRGIIALGLDEGDELIAVGRVKAGDHVLLSTKHGMSIRFDEADARAMGRTAHGVRGINVGEDDEVVGMVVANGEDDPASLLTVCSNGYGKRTSPDRVPLAGARRQGPDRHQDDRPQRPGRRHRQGHRRRRGDDHDRRRHHHPDPDGRRQHDRPEHPGRPADPGRRGRHGRLARQAPRGGAQRQRRDRRGDRGRGRDRRPTASRPRATASTTGSAPPRRATTRTTSTPTASPTPSEQGPDARMTDER